MHDVKTISIQTLETLKKHGGRVHSVFKRTLNIVSGRTLITLAHHVGEGRHHVTLRENLDVKGKGIQPGDPVKVSHELLLIGTTTFSLQHAHVKEYRPFSKTYMLEPKHYRLLDDLKTMLIASDKPSIYDDDAETILGRRLLQTIRTYLDNTTAIESLLGLGIGLTPLGDDFVLGYILATQTLGETVIDDTTLDEYAHRTNQISLQALRDTLNHDYSQSFIAFLEDFYIRHSLEGAEQLLDYGASSGAAIIAGFIEAINSRR